MIAVVVEIAVVVAAVVVGVVSAVVVVTVVGMVEVVLVAVITVTVEVVVVLAVVIRALLWAGEVIGTFVEMLTDDMLVDVLIIVFNGAVDFLMDKVTGIKLDARTDIEVRVLVGVNVNVFAGAMTDFEFAMPVPLKVFGC